MEGGLWEAERRIRRAERFLETAKEILADLESPGIPGGQRRSDRSDDRRISP